MSYLYTSIIIEFFIQGGRGVSLIFFFRGNGDILILSLIRVGEKKRSHFHQRGDSELDLLVEGGVNYRDVS